MAKALAAIDILSDGRLVVDVGRDLRLATMRSFD
jgi:alkanesulfonate monooxygenase SsuD/methylene tetrahydromethanopterin reductase-like flavin-dependent oxidoreductase (luciferase family)